MKFFKSTIMAMLGLAFALTSCSDDNNYEPGTNSPGAYFAQGDATAFNISPTGTSFDVKVFRTSDAPATYDITSYMSADVAPLFNVPSTVTFAAGETIANITITYDPAKLEEVHPYEISLMVGSETKYGRNSVNISVTMQPSMETEPYGIGTYTYADIAYEGLDPDLPMTISYMPANPNNVIYTINHWGADMDLQITCADKTAVASDGGVTVYVPCQYLGEDDEEAGRIFVADAYSYYMDRGLPEDAQDYLDASYYDVEKGLFNLLMVYYVPDYMDGTYWFTGSPAYEYFQLDGYPDNTVNIVYDGMFTDREQNQTARATIYAGADVSEVKAIMIEGTNPQAGVDAILAGDPTVQSYTGGGTHDASFPVTKGGEFTIVAVSYDTAGEPANAAYDTFEIMVGITDDSSQWQDYGMVDYADGWVIAAFSMGDLGLEPLDWAYSVPVQKYIGSESVEGELFRLVGPYGADVFPLGPQNGVINTVTAKRNIQFNILGQYAGIYPQKCGFGLASWGGEMTIGTVEGLYMSENDISLELAINVILSGANAPLITTYYDNTVEVAIPLWAAPYKDNKFGYNWSNYKASYIFMPDAPADVRAKVKARTMARPKVAGLATKAAATRAIKVNKKLMPNKVGANAPKLRDIRF